jgi:hypothetical protein
MRRRVVMEILNTEASYVEAMTTMLDVYLRPLRNGVKYEDQKQIIKGEYSNVDFLYIFFVFFLQG